MTHTAPGAPDSAGPERSGLDEVILAAPFDAWISSLAEIPDEAFATGLLGEGFALDPLEGVVRAPCDGEIVALATTGHSVTLRHAGGAEILIHVGVDTLNLRGEGFEPVVNVGSRVATGDELLRFDLDRVARVARSMMTPLALVGDGFRLAEVMSGRRVPAGEQIARIRPLAVQEASAATSAVGDTLMRRLRVPFAHGVHARPAARIVATVKPYDAEVVIGIGDRRGNARSVTSLLKLDVREGDEVVLQARGRDAAEALDALEKFITSELQDDARLASADAEAAARQDRPTLPIVPDTISGIRAAPGGAMGVAVQWADEDLTISEKGGSPRDEREALAAAIDKIRLDLHGVSDHRDIAEAHLAILDDPELGRAMAMRVDAGMSAPSACRAAIRSEVAALQGTGNPLLAERAADLIDVERRLIASLLGQPAREIVLPEHAIILADELLPSTFLSLDLARVAGIATAAGGPTAHAAILAASRGVPMLVACGGEVLAIPDGTPLILDAVRPRLLVTPGSDEVARFHSEITARLDRALAEATGAQQDCFTADGRRIEVFANCGSAEDARVAARNGAEGCGLLRTEFLFLNRREPPSEGEQVASYASVADAFADRPLIIRTLDAGSDKPLPYLPMAPEENPALGTRGIRLSLTHPDLLEQQFVAILKAVPTARCRIMLPMLADLAELRAARALLRAAERRLAIAASVELGIMVETPAAALLAERLAREADFLSVGSNDLTQYALAADRQNPAVAPSADSLHPAVLRLIAMAAEGAHAHRRWLGVCGSIASDPAAAAILIGLGVDELSVSPPMVPAIKARVRTLDSAGCRRLAESALQAANAADVRKLIEETQDAPAL